MADLNLQEIHDTLISVAHEAGRMMLAANPTDIDQGTKLNCKFASTYIGESSPPFCPSMLRGYPQCSPSRKHALLD